jgi:hypothetical protein
VLFLTVKQSGAARASAKAEAATNARIRSKRRKDGSEEYSVLHEVIVSIWASRAARERESKNPGAANFCAASYPQKRRTQEKNLSKMRTFLVAALAAASSAHLCRE